MNWIYTKDRMPNKTGFYKVMFDNGEILKVPFIKTFSGEKVFLWTNGSSVEKWMENEIDN